MGDTKNAKDPAVSTTWRIRVAIALAIGAAFWLGYTLAMSEREDAGPANLDAGTAPSASHPPVQLQLDAGGLTLAPDGGLHLKPLPTVDPDDLYRDSLDAGPPVPDSHTPP